MREDERMSAIAQRDGDFLARRSCRGHFRAKLDVAPTLALAAPPAKRVAGRTFFGARE
jgi:hypothetical protein